MEELIAGLILAIVCGITFVAYRYPKEYEILGIILVSLTLAAFVGLDIWNTAIFCCWKDLNSVPDTGATFFSPFARIRFVGKAQEKIEENQIDPESILRVTLGVIAFLGGLACFPSSRIVDRRTDGSSKE